LFRTISQGTEELLVEINISETEHPLDRRTDRLQLFEDKRKGLRSCLFHELVLITTVDNPFR
jgi:hypothetical protein